MPLIDAGGVGLNAVELGKGRPVVMVHGLFDGSSASWYFTCAPYLANDYRVLLYDLRGHGRSDRPCSGYDTRTLAEDLGSLLDSMGLTGPVSLVGQSYGALVALRFALAHPERVDRLALVEAPLPPSREPEVRQFLSLPPEEMAKSLVPQTQAMLMSGGRRARKMISAVSALVLQTTLLRDLLAEPDVSDEELEQLDSPLLVYGDQSSCLDVGERLSRVIPGARLEVLPGGHNLHLDAAAQMGPLLAEHLRRRAPRPERARRLEWLVPQFV